MLDPRLRRRLERLGELVRARNSGSGQPVPGKPPETAGNPPPSGAPRVDLGARERLERQAEQLRRRARLVRGDQAEQLKRDLEHLTARAFELVDLGLPLKAYEVYRAAQLQAARWFAEVPPTQALLERILRRGRWELEGFALEIFQALLELALHVGDRRGYHPSTGEVAFHLPQLALALYLWPDARLETARKRLQRGLKALAELGCVSYKARVGNAKDTDTGEALGWKDGTVFSVRLRAGRAAPLLKETLAHPWRDLDGDTRRGRTIAKLIRAALSQSQKTVDRLMDKKSLKEWALPPSLLNSQSLTDWDTSPEAVHVALRNAVQDVKHATEPTRMQFIGAAAGAISRNMMDGHSRWLYFALLGGARALYERGTDRFKALQAHIGEVLSQYGRGEAHRPGAVLVTRLKEAGLWDELMGAWERCAWKAKAPPEAGGAGAGGGG